jgi:hypothetical protein
LGSRWVMTPWHVRDPAGYARELAAVQQSYPQLHATIQGDDTHISGCFPIREDESEVDRFIISMDLRPTYPDSLPVVRELGGRIPHTLDRHVIPNLGVACVMVPDQRWELWPKGASLLAFLDGPLRNYFIGQALVERGEPWPFSEWAHGFQGRQEYYKGLLGTDDPRSICVYLDYLGKHKVKGHWNCPCLSGRRMRDCNFPLVKELRARMPRSEANRLLRDMIHTIEELKKA